MSRLHVVTGSASGIGAATAERLVANGHKVIGVDIRNADVTADLSTPTGRNDAIEQVKALAPDGIDGILTSAGSANFDNLDVLVALNYFGTTKFLEGLHPIIRKLGGRCVAVSSGALLQADDESLILQEACLAGDEGKAVDIAKNKDFLLPTVAVNMHWHHGHVEPLSLQNGPAQVFFSMLWHPALS